MAEKLADPRTEAVAPVMMSFGSRGGGVSWVSSYVRERGKGERKGGRTGERMGEEILAYSRRLRCRVHGVEEKGDGFLGEDEEAATIKCQ